LANHNHRPNKRLKDAHKKKKFSKQTKKKMAKGGDTSSSSAAISFPWWITLWLIISAPVQLWDALFIMFRPRSMVGGDLFKIWIPCTFFNSNINR